MKNTHVKDNISWYLEPKTQEFSAKIIIEI